MTTKMTTEIQKSQTIRALDVWVLGPLMIYAATSRHIPGWAKLALGVTGTMTILYNSHNYLMNARLRSLRESNIVKLTANVMPVTESSDR